MDRVMDRDPFIALSDLPVLRRRWLRAVSDDRSGAPEEIRTPNLLIRSAKFTR
jgi:hypothetical protein